MLEESDKDKVIEELIERKNNEERVLRYLEALKPNLSKDGSMWCYLLGENLQEGLAGFGVTPYKAAVDFVNHFVYEKIVDNQAKGALLTHE